MLSFLKRKKNRENTIELKAFVSGKVIPITDVADEAFSSKIMGEGLAIQPEGRVISAPCDGTVSVVMADTRHAVGLRLDNGAELLLHEGLDTVSMNGEGFELFVKTGDQVRTGDKLLSFTPELIREKGLDTTCVLLLTNSEDFPHADFFSGMTAVQGETVIGEI